MYKGSPRIAVVGLAAMGVLYAGGIEAQQTAHDLRGTWKVDATSLVLGAGGHHPAGAPPAGEAGKPRLRQWTATLRIDGQQGESFWGTFAGEDYQEDFLGMFTGEGGRFIAVDSDGFYEGNVSASNMMRFCYQHIKEGQRVLCCNSATRQ